MKNNIKKLGLGLSLGLASVLSITGMVGCSDNSINTETKPQAKPSTPSEEVDPTQEQLNICQDHWKMQSILDLAVYDTLLKYISSDLLPTSLKINIIPLAGQSGTVIFTDHAISNTLTTITGTLHVKIKTIETIQNDEEAIVNRLSFSTYSDEITNITFKSQQKSEIIKVNSANYEFNTKEKPLKRWGKSTWSDDIICAIGDENPVTFDLNSQPHKFECKKIKWILSPTKFYYSNAENLVINKINKQSPEPHAEPLPK